MNPQQLPISQRRSRPFTTQPSRLFRNRGPVLALLLALALFLAFALPSRAGVVINRDKKSYVLVAHWDDLSPPERQEIHPGEKLYFEDKPCTIEVIGQRDNMYMRPRETIYLFNGVLRRLTGE